MKTVSICVCTFRRESLRDTLASLGRLDIPPDVSASVVVVDNDDEPSAEAIVHDASIDLPLTYVHAPGRNISIARNAALDAATGRYVAFIDDDETVSRAWLAALFAELESRQADVVLGPVDAEYPSDAPAWMRTTRVHATRPVWTDGTIRMGYTCNVLFDRESPALRGLRFDIAAGGPGGEDTLFFGAASVRGARIAFAPDAVVYEPVAPARQSFSWLARRRFRMGRTHARLLLEVNGVNRFAALPLAAAKAAYCAAATVLSLPARRVRNSAALRFLMHLGIFTGLVRGSRAATETSGATE